MPANLEMFLHRGSLKIGTLYEYRRIEHYGNIVGDIDEGLHKTELVLPSGGERLFNEDLARAFFERVKLSAQWSRLASDEHFSVDGPLIEAWASHKSFKRKDDDSGTPPGRNPEVDFKGQERRYVRRAFFQWPVNASTLKKAYQCCE